MNPKKILVIKLRSMGDTIILTAPLWELKKAYPMAQIHVLTLEAWAPLLEKHPAVAQVIPYIRHKEATSRAKAVARMSLKLRRESYDLVVNFHASPSSSMMAFASGARTRSIHFHGHKDRNRYSTVEVPGKGEVKPAIERDMDALRALGLDIEEGHMPRVYLSALENEQGNNILDTFDAAYPTMVVGLGASRPTKQWPVERFAELSQKWIDDHGGSVVSITGPGEEALSQEFSTLLDAKVKNKERTYRAHALPLRELAALIGRCNLYCGNDTGPKHLSVSLGLPSVTLIGPEHPYEWHPYPVEQHPYFFVENLTCRKDGLEGMPPWCGLKECTVEKHKCMRNISVQEVLDQCLSISK